ncbi:unnamed protein product [Timema podura]|uniref:Uncharacterized protein n=1 Tax=Timema podura TaxID=61482 RepID=A0ABN7P2K0_TIMPD|nr:unnamed protein product [Timema podura]
MLSACSYISGITVLGIPAEMYLFGTQYWMSVTVEVFVNITMIFAYLPIFYTLQITSSYEYLKLRFNQSVCLLGSALFLLKLKSKAPNKIIIRRSVVRNPWSVVHGP